MCKRVEDETTETQRERERDKNFGSSKLKKFLLSLSLSLFPASSGPSGFCLSILHSPLQKCKGSPRPLERRLRVPHLHVQTICIFETIRLHLPGVQYTRENMCQGPYTHKHTRVRFWPTSLRDSPPIFLLLLAAYSRLFLDEINHPPPLSPSLSGSIPQAVRLSSGPSPAHSQSQVLTRTQADPTLSPVEDRTTFGESRGPPQPMLV